jgi:hypothetical protein
LPGKDALAYYENLQLTAVKSFITLAPELESYPSFGRAIKNLTIKIAETFIENLPITILVLQPFTSFKYWYKCPKS